VVGVLPKKKDSNLQQYIYLCSPDTKQVTISVYSVTLQLKHGITDLNHSFFIKRNNYETDVYSYNVGLHLRYGFLHTIEVGHTLSLMPGYLCQETGAKLMDFFQAMDYWQKEGPQYDCVLIQGWPFLYPGTWPIFSLLV